MRDSRKIEINTHTQRVCLKVTWSQVTVTLHAAQCQTHRVCSGGGTRDSDGPTSARRRHVKPAKHAARAQKYTKTRPKTRRNTKFKKKKRVATMGERIIKRIKLGKNTKKFCSYSGGAQGQAESRERHVNATRKWRRESQTGPQTRPVLCKCRIRNEWLRQV